MGITEKKSVFLISLVILMGSLLISVDKITSPPNSLKLDPFYTQYLDANGIPIVSSSKVNSHALFIAREIVNHCFLKLPKVKKAMAEFGAYIIIIAQEEKLTTIPEYDYLRWDPHVDWNKRARGMGGTLRQPACSCGEENLLCLKGDGYRGENILIHELAHTIHLVGFRLRDQKFQINLDKIYQKAIKKGLWKNTYAGKNSMEYWAEGVQTWFNCNRYPQKGIHNEINTRDELKSYDPDLYNFLKKFFPDDHWKPACPKSKTKNISP